VYVCVYNHLSSIIIYQWLFFQNVIQLQPHGSKNPIVLYEEMWLQRWLHVSKLFSAAVQLVMQPPLQPHFLVQYNRVFTTMWLQLNHVLEK